MSTINLKYALAALIIGMIQTVQFASATDYKVDPVHSNVGFTIRHLVGRVSGSFKDYEGSFSFDEKAATKAAVKFTIKATSIDTANEKRDGHLRSPDFFDVEKHPSILFESKSLESSGGKKYKLSGSMTMHGVTKPTVFSIEYLGQAKDMEGNMRNGFTASAKINRKGFGIVWNKAMDRGGLVLGDDVDLLLQIEGVEVKK